MCLPAKAMALYISASLICLAPASIIITSSAEPATNNSKSDFCLASTVAAIVAGKSGSLTPSYDKTVMTT